MIMFYRRYSLTWIIAELRSKKFFYEHTLSGKNKPLKMQHGQIKRKKFKVYHSNKK